MAKQAVAEGMCVVIGLQSTGEANTNLLKELKNEEFDDLVSGGCELRGGKRGCCEAAVHACLVGPPVHQPPTPHA